MSQKKHADHIYVEALLKNDSRVLSKVYEKFSPKIVAMVVKNSGCADDAQDIIQETLVTIFHQASEKNFILTCPFDAYFYLLCKRSSLFCGDSFNYDFINLNQTSFVCPAKI